MLTYIHDTTASDCLVSCLVTLCSVSCLQGRQQDAESQWDYACTNITVGCKKYQDPDWLRRIRR